MMTTMKISFSEGELMPKRAVDELATRVKEMVITQLADRVHEDGDKAAEDRPWRAEE